MDLKNWQLINEFSKVKILVIGDLMLDIYLKGNSTRISPEAPVPVVNVREELMFIGGAANVAANLKALGATVFFSSVCGKDAAAGKAVELLQAKGINTEYLVHDKKRDTLVKERIMVQEQILTRFDKGTTSDISDATRRHLINGITSAYARCDAVIIADYNKGILTKDVVRSLTTLHRKKPIFLAVDSKHLGDFKPLHPTLVKPNYQEATQLLKIPCLESGRNEQIKRYGEYMNEITGAEINVVTLDAEGSLVFKNGILVHQSAAIPIVHPNVVGAGDTFISALTLALICKAKVSMATELATTAAAISVKKKDTACCTDIELRSFFLFGQKYIANLKELGEICDIYRIQKKKIVFTNGCFDILHCGHVNYLKDSGRLGDILIVAINDDASIRRLKGPGRPVNPLADRVEVIAGLASVNHIISFGQKEKDSPSKIIKVIKPDIFVKGGDYTRALLPEAPLVEKLGGVVRLLPLTPNHSTTKVIQRIHETYAAG